MRTHVKEKFPPEFLSRIDHVIVFRPLSYGAIAAITGLQLELLSERLAEQGITLAYDKEIIDYIAKASYSPTLGAREIRKYIQEEVESKIAKKILTAKNRRSKHLVITIKNKKLSV